MFLSEKSVTAVLFIYMTVKDDLCAEPHLVLAGGEVNSDPRLHGLGVSKEGVKAEGVLLQIFPLDVAKARLRIKQRGTSDYCLNLDESCRSSDTGVLFWFWEDIHRLDGTLPGTLSGTLADKNIS